MRISADDLDQSAANLCKEYGHAGEVCVFVRTTADGFRYISPKMTQEQLSQLLSKCAEVVGQNVVDEHTHKQAN